MTPLDHAIQFHRLGLSVIPVPRPRVGVAPGQPGDGKVPAIAWREFQQRHASDAEIRRWFSSAPMNIAVITGAISGVVVVDGDSPEAIRWLTAHLPYTPWQTQTSKGFHLWYRHPGVAIPNRARISTRIGKLAIDVRGDGGFVIAPGSLHASGAEYRAAGDWSVPREQVPVFWRGWLERPNRERPTDTNRPKATGDVVERAGRYLARVPKPEIGKGSDAETLYAACRLVRGFEIPANDAIELLWEWAGGRPGWSREWIARKVDHALRYGSEPLGALR